MINKNINEQLPLFANDNFKVNFHEIVEGYSNSELASNSEDEIISVPEESVPTGKSEANLRKKENTRKKGRFPTYRKISDIEPKPINWLWEDYMAKGAITLITGEPELG